MRVASVREFRRRKAVTGVLASIIMFSMLFTVLFGFLIYNNVVNLQNQKASDQRQAEVQQQAAENLALWVGFKSAADPWGQIGDLWVVANNTGSAPVTISDVYVTKVATSSLVSNSVVNPGSNYLNTENIGVKGDLNVNLPISITVGGSTAAMTTCSGDPYGCDIAVSQKAFNYVPGTAVQVSVVTSTGNVFSAQYPAHIIAPTGFATNPLVLSLVATPPQTLSCVPPTCITVIATVYNYANAPITSVQLSPTVPTAQVTGTAGVSGGSCTGPSPSSTIPAFTGGNPGGPVTFTCTYSASTGAVGGFASFSTRATGTLSGAAVSSAQEVSNSVQIGGTVSVLNQGPFSANSFFFKDTYCSFTKGQFWVYPCIQTPSGTLSINALPNANPQNASSNYYVAYYLQITNNFNTTLSVLQYSYFQTDPSLGGESDFYLVGAASSYNTNGYYFPTYLVTTGAPTLTAYGGDALTCQNNPGNCISIAPGQSIYLTFASCKAGSSSWNWGDVQYGRAFDDAVGCSPQSPPNYQTPEATYLSIVVSFLYKGQVFDQQIPFQGETVFGAKNPPPSCATGNYCGTVVYTQYTGTVGYFYFVYNPAAKTFTIPTPHVINNNLPYGADGVAYNPQDHKLIVGTNNNDQSPYINEVDPNTGVVTSYGTSPGGQAIYSLNVMVSSDGTRIYSDGDGCQSNGSGGCLQGSQNLAWANLGPTPGASNQLTLSGSDTVVNTVIFMSPTVAYYVAELGPQFQGQHGHIGTLNPQTGVTTCFKTGSSCTDYQGVHGASYDPFTKDLIVFGWNIVSQVNATTGAVIASETIGALDTSTGNFDQGAVDGFGHLFISWAGNPGYLYFEDYSSGKICNGNFATTCSTNFNVITNGGNNDGGTYPSPQAPSIAFNYIDDLAPIVGPGSQG
jgi:hypothetical protein